MSSNNKMLKGMLIGAAVGAVVSLFDKETRESFIHTSKQVGKKTVDVLRNPGEYTSKVRDQINSVKTTIEQISEDVRLVSGTVNEISEATPQIVEAIKETKEAFTSKGSSEINE